MSRHEPPDRHETDENGRGRGGGRPNADFSGRLQVPADSERRLLSASDVAEFCGVATTEVVGWIESGKLIARQMRSGGYRIAAGDFMAFFNRYTILI